MVPYEAQEKRKLCEICMLERAMENSALCKKCKEDDERRDTQDYSSDDAASYTDAVNHPAHYCAGKYETIEVIEDWCLGYHLGNAIKYISRAGKKDPAKTAEDLRKAIWYINRFIESGCGE